MPRLSAVNEGSCSVSVSSSSDEVGIVKTRDMAGMATFRRPRVRILKDHYDYIVSYRYVQPARST
jgi:hypothetical protein